MKGCYLGDTLAELVHTWCVHDARMTYAWYMCSLHGTCLGEEVAELVRLLLVEPLDDIHRPLTQRLLG